MLTRLVPSRLAAVVFLAAVLLPLVLCAPRARAQVVTEAEVRDWLEAELEHAADLHTLKGMYFSWTETLVYSLPEDKLKELSDAVARYPDHPSAGFIEAWKRHSAGNFTTFEYSAWWKSGDSFRLNQDTSLGNPRDVIRTPSHSWDLLASELYTYAPRGEPPGLGPTESRFPFNQGLSDLFASGLISVALVKHDDYELEQVKPERWEVRFRLSSSRLLRGLIGQHQGRLVMLETRVEGDDLVDPIPTWFVRESFTEFPGFDRPVPMVIRHLRANGVEDRIITFNGLRALEDGEFDRVTTPPSPTGASSDSVRGPLASDLNVTDYQGGFHNRAAGVSAVPDYAPGVRPGTATTPLQWVAGSFAGVLVACAIAWRIRAVSHK